VLRKSDTTMSLKNWPVDYQSILLAALYAKNDQREAGKAKFQELSKSLEEGLLYYSGFSGSQKESILDDADYKLSLYNELIKQASDTLPELELKAMKDRLMAYANKFS